MELIQILSPLLLIPIIFLSEIKTAIKQMRCKHKSFTVTGTSNFAFVLWNVHTCDNCGKEKMTMKSKYD